MILDENNFVYVIWFIDIRVVIVYCWLNIIFYGIIIEIKFM